MDSYKNKTIHILMFPWLGYGHVTPYLELAKKLSTRNFVTYLCSTPANLHCVEKQINEKLSEFVKLVPLHLPVLPGLPPEFHTTNGLPHHLMSKLKQALDLSAPDFFQILAKLKPDLLIYDFLQPWAPLAAAELNIPAVEFITSSSTSTCFMFHHFKNPSEAFPYPTIYFREYEHENRKKLMDSAVDPKEREMAFKGVDRSCKIVLVKGFRDIEGKYIDYVTSLIGKTFVPVGPLVQEPSMIPDCGNNCLDILSWLDRKEKKSTVFVSFGSEYFLSKEDIEGIAYGLELSDVNFIWVVRFPKDMSRNGVTLLEKALPKGFIDRVGERGMIVEGWAPQAKILGHANTGGFVSHCGWNSVMESMNFGVPIIALPMHLDQPINARLVEEVGVGVEVVRDGKGRLHEQTLAAVIKHVVMDDCGEFVRQKALEMRDQLKAKGDREMDEVVKELVELCTMKNIV